MADNSSSVCISADSCSADGIIRACYSSVEWSSKTNFCDCNFSPGWHGADCDEPSAMLNFSRVFNVSVIIFTTIASIMIMIDLGYIMYINHIHWPKHAISIPVPLILTGVGTLLAYWCHFASAIIELSAMIKPNKLVLLEVIPSFSVVVTPNLTLHVVFLFLALGFSLVAQIQITLSWLKVTEKMEIFNVFSSKAWQRAIKVYKIFAQTVTWLSIVVALYCGLTLKVTQFSIAGPVFILLVNLLVLIGRQRFVSVVSTLSMDTAIGAKYKRPLFLVRTASFYVLFFCFCFMALLIASLIVSAHTPAALYVEPGSFNYSTLITDLSFVAGYCSFMTYQWYFHKIVYSYKQMMSTSNSKMTTGVTGHHTKHPADIHKDVVESQAAPKVEGEYFEKVSPFSNQSL